jgi:hypothetical protein
MPEATQEKQPREKQPQGAVPQSRFHFNQWLPWLFIGIILILVYFGVKDIVVMAADAQGSATLTAAELKDRVDELKWILTLIVTTAGLFTVAQGIAAGFNAQNFTKQAESTLSELEKKAQDFSSQAGERVDELKKFEGEVKARFPIYPQMAELWSNAFANLTANLQSDSPVQNPDEGFHWKRGFYEKLHLTIRQELISAEQIVPYEIAGKNDPDAVYVLKLRRLGRFYWSKFIYESSRASGTLVDLEHAEYLLELATRRVGKAFYLLNDLGNIYIEHFRARSRASPASERSEMDEKELKKILDRARTYFEDSIAARKEQLRAYFDLAYIEADLSGAPAPYENLRKAVDHLRKGIRYPNWEHEPVAEFRCQAVYNLACFYARLAPRSKCAKESFVPVLRKAAKFGLTDPDDVARDFYTKTGDFYAFVQYKGSDAEDIRRRDMLLKLEKPLSLKYK